MRRVAPLTVNPIPSLGGRPAASRALNNAVHPTSAADFCPPPPACDVVGGDPETCESPGAEGVLTTLFLKTCDGCSARQAPHLSQDHCRWGSAPPEKNLRCVPLELCPDGRERVVNRRGHNFHADRRSEGDQSG